MAWMAEVGNTVSSKEFCLIPRCGGGGLMLSGFGRVVSIRGSVGDVASSWDGKRGDG